MSGAPGIPGPSLLFCPGDRPDRYAKAAARADAVIIDLEDSVAPDAKDAARRMFSEAWSELDPERTIVRVNPFGGPWWEGDVQAVRDLGVRLVMLPKAEQVEAVRALAPARVVALCESAAGVLAAPAIAAEPGCAALTWGGEDLMADLGGASSRRSTGGLHDVVAHARSSVLLAAAAHGKPAVDTVYLDISDTDGLAAEAREAAETGFAAKMCIHPGHADPIREAFRPPEEEVRWARGVLKAAGENPSGVFRYEGRMIDAPLLGQARAILRRAGE
ncbi:HpcH/HpaI aldolase/citrate lyase family protein [Nocardiopsis suaedae]|uniref:CoA ester lyase n=1 Tax=Nocardiopsis suaedae TaxID=3018444 RepID=A0ABT4TH35_9ACTN|nr:CoA ester lyase [Nocardiopsis suaedae]MDA2803970.1 CoA ester lyase [Nocardiopsis suaedae]